MRVPFNHNTKRHSFCSITVFVVCLSTRDADTSNQETPVSLWSGAIITGLFCPVKGAIMAEGTAPLSRRISCTIAPHLEMNPRACIFSAKACVICSATIVKIVSRLCGCSRAVCIQGNPIRTVLLGRQCSRPCFRIRYGIALSFRAIRHG